MNSKLEVKKVLTDKGYPYLFTDENYRISKLLVNMQLKTDKKLKSLCDILEGTKEELMADTIIKNKAPKVF